MERQIVAKTRLFLCPFFFSLIFFSLSLKKGSREGQKSSLSSRSKIDDQNDVITAPVYIQPQGSSASRTGYVSSTHSHGSSWVMPSSTFRIASTLPVRSVPFRSFLFIFYL